MTQPPKLKTAMTPFPYSIEPDASLAEARKMMEEHQVRHLPVTENHELVGIITDSDLRRAPPKGRKASGKQAVRDRYVTDVYVVDLNEPIENVLLTMAERRIGSAVVTRKGRLAGVFTSVDACRCLGEYIRDNFRPPEGNDAA